MMAALDRLQAASTAGHVMGGQFTLEVYVEAGGTSAAAAT